MIKNKYILLKHYYLYGKGNEKISLSDTIIDTYIKNIDHDQYFNEFKIIYSNSFNNFNDNIDIKTIQAYIFDFYNSKNSNRFNYETI